MSTAKNKSIVRRLLESAIRRDLAAVDERGAPGRCVAEAVEWDSVGDDP
jgi:hypothetical protein